MSIDAEFREARAKLEQYRQVMEMLRAAVETGDEDRIVWVTKKAVRQAEDIEK